MTARQNVFWGGLVVLLFFGALRWAGEQDPFSRKSFTLKTSDGGSMNCVTVFPKPMRQYPVVIYAHGRTGNVLTDGTPLRQMAELGLATVNFDYDQTNETAFASQFGTILHYLGRQRWANTNTVAWFGLSLGANRMLDFALHHPEQQPQLLVQLSGSGLSLSSIIHPRFSNLGCRVLLVHGDQDEIFPAEDTKRLASVLHTNGVPVELKIISGASHGMELERGVIFRCIGEYCLTHLTCKDAWQNYHSIAQWQAEASSFWSFCIPATAWAIGWFVWWRRRKTAQPEGGTPSTVLRWLAAILATWVLAETALHLAPPHFPVNDTTLSMARRFLVQPRESTDFELLAAQPIWRGQKLKTLLEHVELARYNRELINWQLDDKIYGDFVLSPVITGETNERFDWCRPLWEEFYPRIRHESSPEDAAKIVVRHLRERVTIATLPNPSHDVPTIWLRQITDEAGFEIIYVAALRSVGVPARLDSNNRAEFLDGNKWQAAQQPSVVSW